MEQETQLEPEVEVEILPEPIRINTKDVKFDKGLYLHGSQS